MRDRSAAERVVVWLAFAAMLAILAVLMTQPINLAAVDLGRHLKNGELFFATGAPIGTNFYSFTEPDFPVINHHWLSGALFYLLWKTLGFAGLQAVYVGLHVLTVGLLVWAAGRRADWRVVLLVCVALLPLLANRTEIRPEGLSYLALAALVCGLGSQAEPRRPLWQVLVPVAVLSVLWVNSHIFFFLGWVVTGAFLVQAVAEGGFALRPLADPASPQGRLLLILLTQIAASLVNPWGVTGALEPFTILREYGYTVVENQPIPFLLQRVGGGVYWHFVGVGVVTGVLVITALRRGLAAVLAPVLLLLTFYGLGFFAIRGMTMFALLAIPFASVLVSRLIQHDALRWACLALAGTLMLAAITLRTPYFSVQRHPPQLGLMPGVQGAGEFIKRAAIDGPIFNNYDVGGYFIFHLYPQHRVFVDNRPEAYSVKFLRGTYQAMLADEAVWREQDARHQFNAIFFYRHDATEPAQPFLIRRINDPAWAPVMVDEFNLVLVRRNDKNARLIRDYGLPPDLFSVVPN